MTIITIDGIKTKVRPPDIDGDGQIGGVELLNQRFDTGTQDIVQPTELGESLRELNDDSIAQDTRMSGIDMRSNLHHMEIPGILAIDALVAFKFLPINCLSFTRQKKRLAVSLNAFGRRNIVDIVSGNRNHDEQIGAMSFGDKAKSFLGLGGQK